MTAREAMPVLRRNQVGRLAYTLHDEVEVQPVHYVVDGRWIYVRTSPGGKTAVLRRNRWIAFQTDEVESAFSWRSVLVRGTAYTLSEDATPDLVRRYQRARTFLRRVFPAALTPDDPVPFRTILLGIHIEEITGREAREAPVPHGRR
jgi:nitroimidazol reductase NimA-like FMN-containing flavoprotein (pyridoxamine 5'-phosphate oxidase superfamily)